METRYRIAGILLAMALPFLLVACGSETAGARGVSAETGAPQAGTKELSTVHMSNTEFVPRAITISQGAQLILVADTFAPHFISNGTWENNRAVPMREAGAPAVENLQIDGNSSTTLPAFATRGTYNLYCTIHPGMNLLVTVEG